MSARGVVKRLCFMLLVVFFAETAHGQPNFGNNDVTFNDPAVVGGNTIATVVTQAPKKVKLPDGMRILQLSYTVTAVSGQEVDLSWSATRPFNLPAAATLDLRNVGSTHITMGGGNNRVDLMARPMIDGLLPPGVTFISATLTGPLNQRSVSWDKYGLEARPAGNRSLRLDSGIVWQPNAAGDTITVTSFYQAQVGPARVRINYKNLTATQRNQYVEAVKALKAKGGEPNYDTFVSAHALTLYTDGHIGPLFLPWHRQFIYEIENSLRALDVHTEFNADGEPVSSSAKVKYAAAVGALPYWDWRDPFPSFLGKVGGIDEIGVVTDGPFRKDKWVVNVEGVGLTANEKKHLHRGFPDVLDVTKIGVDISHALARPVYDERPWDSEKGSKGGGASDDEVGTDIGRSFRNALEGWVHPETWAPGDYRGYKDTPRMHNRAHVYVGGSKRRGNNPNGTPRFVRGNMTYPPSAPNDPSFWLHHAFVDKLWCEWQTSHPDSPHYLPQSDLAEDAPHPARALGVFTALGKLKAFAGSKDIAPFDTLSIRAQGFRYDNCSGPPTGLCCVVKPNGDVLQFENLTESQKDQLGPPRIPAGSTKSWHLGMSKADDLNKNCMLDDDELKAGKAQDCNSNAVPDDAEVDCDDDGTPDLCEILAPGDDCNSDGLSDLCQPDCNANATPDACETFIDCNNNGVPDECDLAVFDCDSNGTLDGCEAIVDCNSNGTPDECDLSNGSTDCDDNGTLDECDLASGAAADCNVNVMLDICELASGEAYDCNTNGIPDECDGDCNNNGSADECDIASHLLHDCDSDGRPDECHIQVGVPMDCNTNGMHDVCEGLPDCDTNGIPDECELVDNDCNANGTVDACEIAGGVLADCDGDGVPNSCEGCGDIDGSENIDGQDYSLLLSALGHTVYEPEYDPGADLFYDGAVECVDLSRWLCCYQDFVGDPESAPPQPDPPVAFADCNLDRVPDECNIAGGTSQDCNNNRTPDECDLSGGTSSDLNADLVLDECQAGPVVYVNGAAAAGGDGLNWNTAFNNVQDGLLMARGLNSPVEEVWVAAGVYAPAGPGGDRAASFALVNGVAVYGGFAGTETSLAQRSPAINVAVLTGDLNGDDGPNFANFSDNAYHVVTAGGVGSATRLDGFVVTGGSAHGPPPHNVGAGMLSSGGSPTVANCTFVMNTADFGGGGYYAEQDSDPVITRCRFSRNRSTNPCGNCGGGGFHAAFGSDATLINCLFDGNTALDFAAGGGVFFRESSHGSLINCVLTNNQAETGGAICCSTSNLAVTNCAIFANTGTLLGGACYIYRSDLVITNSILWNDASPNGSELALYCPSAPFISHSDVEGGALGVYTLDGICAPNWGSGNIEQDPLLDGVGRPATGSPVIDTGNDAAIPPDLGDLDGDSNLVEVTPLDLGDDPRQLGPVDMGAYEALGAPAATVTGAVSRKTCDLSLVSPRQSEPRSGGITEVRIAFNVPPGGPGPTPLTIEQATCAAPAFVAYSGATVVSASIAGSELVATFSPALENLRSYRLNIAGSVTSVNGQFVEVRGLVADVNSDGRVNALDRSVVVGAWTGGGFTCATDVNGDAATNALDRSIVVGAWTGTANCAP